MYEARRGGSLRVRAYGNGSGAAKYRTHRPSAAIMRLTSVTLNGAGSSGSSSSGYSTGEAPW
jgi:hypothetical protein